MKRFRALVESAARAFGYSIIPTWRLHIRPQAVYPRRLFDHCGVETVIDDGANEGQYRDFLRNEVGYTGEIISVEPIPALVEKLRDRASEDPRWRIERVCAGRDTGYGDAQHHEEQPVQLAVCS